MLSVLMANLPYLFRGAIQTVLLALTGVGAGTLLGVMLAIAAHYGALPVRIGLAMYTSIVRGVPVLIWMFLAYYGLPMVTWLQLSDFSAVVVALATYAAAFVIEIVRGAIAGVPRAQADAGHALGLSQVQVIRDIVLPQAATVALPALAGNTVMMIKATSYASIIGVWELTYAAREVVERTIAPFQIFLGVMLLYFCICYPLSLLAKWLEQRVQLPSQ